MNLLNKTLNLDEEVGLIDNIVDFATEAYNQTEGLFEGFNFGSVDYSSAEEVVEVLEGKADFEYLGVDGDEVQVSAGDTKYLVDTEEGTYQEQVTGVKGMLGKGSEEVAVEEVLNQGGFSRDYNAL